MTDGAPAESVHYATDIKPLFRSRDQQAMKFALDLYSYDDVSQNADAILDRLRSGSMPCDGRWPSDRVDVFDRWISGGKLP